MVAGWPCGFLLSIRSSEHQASRTVLEKLFVSDGHGLSTFCLFYTKDVCVIHQETAHRTLSPNLEQCLGHEQAVQGSQVLA